MKLKIKVYFYMLLLFILALEAYAQVNLGTAILNSPPSISEIQTYSRYDSSTDNLLENSFFICTGEENRTIHLRIVAQDNNSNLEISDGGNLSFKTAYLINDSEADIPSFGSSYIEPIFESNTGITQVSYIYNITLSNTSFYRITANVTDSNNAVSTGTYVFSINNTDCVRTSQDVNLIANQSYTLQADFTEIDIVVDDNITGRIIITEYNHSPTNITPSDSLDKFVTVDITGPIKNVTVNLSIIINYTDAELSDKGFDEDNLQLYNWNGTDWESAQSTLSTSENTITFTVQGTKNGISDERLGSFSVIGTEEETQDLIQESGNSGTGGGSGGGGIPIRTPANDELSEDLEQNNEGVSAEPDNNVGSPGEDDQDNRTMEYPSAGNPDGNITEQSYLNAITGNVIKEFPLLGDINYCLLIIIILLIVWLITLFLYAKERRKKNALYKIESEKKKLTLKKKKISEKINSLKEKRKKEIETIQKRLNRYKRS